jgi:hypothetical protein
MTDTQREQLTIYVRKLADLLGLRDWELHVEQEGPEGPMERACTYLLDNAHEAYIRFDADRLGDMEQVRSDTIHELIHCHLQNVRNVVGVDLKKTGILSRDAFDLLKEVHDRQEEIAVESLAVVIAPYFPLPEWGEPVPGIRVLEGGAK